MCFIFRPHSQDKLHKKINNDRLKPFIKLKLIYKNFYASLLLGKLQNFPFLSLFNLCSNTIDPRISLSLSLGPCFHLNRSELSKAFRQFPRTHTHMCVYPLHMCIYMHTYTKGGAPAKLDRQ